MIARCLAVATTIALSASALADPLRGSVLENFNGNSLPASLDESGGSAEYVDGAVAFRGWQRRTYLRTKFNYDSTSFVARMTVSIQSGHAGAGGAFIGVGAGFADCAYYAEPRVSPTMYARIFAFDFENGAASITNSNVENLGIIPFAGGDGTHRVQLVWNHKSRKLSVAIQQGYRGGEFSPTATVGPFTATDTYGSNNTRLFFGGSGVYEDLAIIAVEAKKHGGGCVPQGVSRWFRKALLTEADSFREALTQLCEALSVPQ